MVHTIGENQGRTPSIHKRWTLKHHSDIFYNWIPLLCPCVGKYPHGKFSSLSPEFWRGNNAEISEWIIPRNPTQILMEIWWTWIACLLGSHESFWDWSLIWSIYIRVWPQYLHLSSLSKQKFSCRYFKISNHGKYWINQQFWQPDYSFFSENCKKLLVASQIYPRFPNNAFHWNARGSLAC